MSKPRSPLRCAATFDSHAVTGRSSSKTVIPCLFGSCPEQGCCVDVAGAEGNQPPERRQPPGQLGRGCGQASKGQGKPLHCQNLPPTNHYEITTSCPPATVSAFRPFKASQPELLLVPSLSLIEHQPPPWSVTAWRHQTCQCCHDRSHFGGVWVQGFAAFRRAFIRLPAESL